MERLAEIMAVVKTGGLIVQHDVIGARDAHDVIAAGDAEQREQGVHVVLVGLGVVGITDVAAHRQAEEFAAEVVLEPGADDLFAIVEILGANETDDGVDEQGIEFARDGVGAGLEGLLVDAVMGAGGEA